MMIWNPVFVFGSNRAGRHGRGAAFDAVQFYGAERGVGEGRTGQAYAIPTKDENLRRLPLTEIADGYWRFVRHAGENPEETFLLTPIGTGLAGHRFGDIAAMVVGIGIPGNVVLTPSWLLMWSQRGDRDA